jgi:hypothetical protein
MPRPSPGVLAAIVLAGLAILSLVYLVQAWLHVDAEMSIHGWIALTLGGW